MERKTPAACEQEKAEKLVSVCREILLNARNELYLNLRFMDAFPYVIPLNFGEKAADGKTVLYFHGAGEGIKFERLREDNRVAFSMYATEELVLKEPACASTMLYESVCGTGRAFVVEGTEEKTEALTAIMRHYDKNKKEFEFGIKAVEKTTVIRLEVEEMTGKTNRC